VAVVYIDTVHSEYTTNFFDYVSTACFDTISVLKLVRVIRLDSLKFEFVRVAFKYLEIDTLDEQVRLGTRLR
jgi:hypothetical protein